MSQRSPAAYFLVKMALFKLFNLAGCTEIQPSKLWLCVRMSQPDKLVKPNYRNNRKLVQTRRFFGISSTCSVSQIFSLSLCEFRAHDVLSFSPALLSHLSSSSSLTPPFLHESLACSPSQQTNGSRSSGEGFIYFIFLCVIANL